MKRIVFPKFDRAKVETSFCSRNKCHLELLNIQQLLFIPFPLQIMDENLLSVDHFITSHICVNAILQGCLLLQKKDIKCELPPIVVKLSKRLGCNRRIALSYAYPMWECCIVRLLNI